MKFSVCKSVCLFAAMTSLIMLPQGQAQADDKPAAHDKPLEAHAKVIVLKVDKGGSGNVALDGEELSQAIQTCLEGLPDAYKEKIKAELKAALTKAIGKDGPKIHHLRIRSDRDTEKGKKALGKGKRIDVQVEIVGDAIRINGKPALKPTSKQGPRIIKKRIETRLQQATPSSKTPVRHRIIWKDKQGHVIEMKAVVIESKAAGDVKKPHAEHAKHTEHDKHAAHHEDGKPHKKVHAEHHGHGQHAHATIKNAVKKPQPMKVQVHAIRVGGDKKPIAIAVKRLPHRELHVRPQIALRAAANSTDTHQQVVKQLKAIESELKKIRQLLEKMNDDD